MLQFVEKEHGRAYPGQYMQEFMVSRRLSRSLCMTAAIQKERRNERDADVPLILLCVSPRG